MRSVIVDLSAVETTVTVEWFDPARGVSVDGGTERGGTARFLTSPCTGDTVLHVKATSDARHLR